MFCQKQSLARFYFFTIQSHSSHIIRFFFFPSLPPSLPHHKQPQIMFGSCFETSAQPITESEVKALFQVWNSALATLDSDKVAQCYSKNAVLLPTVSDVARTNYALIKDYFDLFLKKEPQGEILESYVNIGHNWCQDVGIYEFTMGTTGDKVAGRLRMVHGRLLTIILPSCLRHTLDLHQNQRCK